MQRMSRPFFQLVFACLIGSDLYAAQAVSGTVRDVTGGAVESAEVVLMTSELTVVATTRSGGDGRFTRAELILPPEKSWSRHWPRPSIGQAAMEICRRSAPR